MSQKGGVTLQSDDSLLLTNRVINRQWRWHEIVCRNVQRVMLWVTLSTNIYKLEVNICWWRQSLKWSRTKMGSVFVQYCFLNKTVKNSWSQIREQQHHKETNKTKTPWQLIWFHCSSSSSHIYAQTFIHWEKILDFFFFFFLITQNSLRKRTAIKFYQRSNTIIHYGLVWLHPIPAILNRLENMLTHWVTVTPAAVEMEEIKLPNMNQWVSVVMPRFTQLTSSFELRFSVHDSNPVQHKFLGQWLII